MSTQWDYTLITHLPLPPPQPQRQPNTQPESHQALLSRSISTALALLHDPTITIKHNKQHLTITPLTPQDPRSVNVTALSESFNVDATNYPPPLSPNLASYSNPGMTTITTTTTSPDHQWHHHHVTELIPLPIPFLNRSSRIEFPTALRNNPDGLEALSDPGSSVTVYLRYTIEIPTTDTTTDDDDASETVEGEEKKNGGQPSYLILREVTTTRCNVLLSWYIKGTMGRHHEDFHAWFRERFVERMAGEKGVAEDTGVECRLD